MKIDCTTADTSVAAGDVVCLDYIIEGYDYAPVEGKAATLSFWVFGTKTGTHCVSFSNKTGDKVYVVEYTINSSDTWEKKTVTVTFDETGGTWDYANGRGLMIRWCLMAGTDWQGTAEPWLTGQELATSNQVNACDNTANNFRLSQIKFEIGSVATPFKARPHTEEIALCQRYYEKSYNLTTDPGTATDVGCISVLCLGGDIGLPGFIFQVQKRSESTIVIYDEDGDSGYVTNVSESTDESVSSIPDKSTYGVRVIAISQPTADSRIHYQWTADAEL